MADGTLAFCTPEGEASEPGAFAAVQLACSASEAEALVAAARQRGRVLEHDQHGIYALGSACCLRAPGGFHGGDGDAVVSLLSRLEDAGSARPLALGALPFRSDEPAELVVPTLVLRRGPTGSAIVAVTRRGEDAGRVLHGALATSTPVQPGAPPERFELVSVESHAGFRALVRRARDTVRAGGLDKVVVAREVRVVADRPFEPGDLLERLRALYPTCCVFSIDGFVGASPELLCRRVDHRVVAHPLAGTVARSGDAEEDARLAQGLLNSAKDRTEHRIVVDAIVEELAKLADEVEVADTPHLLELRNVVHLATPISAALGEHAPSALEIALALHPTPAIGGWPKERALRWIAEHEGLRRDRYAGPLGFVDAAGDGEFWLGIRSALLDGAVARLIAGVGIVADSDPEAELAETQLKLQALLAAAVRP